MPIHSQTATMEMAPTINLPILCPSCRARPPSTITGHSSRTCLSICRMATYAMALQRFITLNIRPNPSYLRKDRDLGKTASWHHRGKHLEDYPPRVRRRRSREATQVSRALSMGCNNSRALRPTSNSLIPAALRVSHRSCRIKCIISSKARNVCKPFRQRCSRHLRKASGSKVRPCPPSMAVETTLRTMEVRATCKACSLEAIIVSLSHLQLAQITRPPY